MTRNEALAAGLTTYDTGKPCKNGHDSPRYASCGVCIACIRESRGKRDKVRNVGLSLRGTGLALFTYRLPPDDHAAALALMQALDFQRGRVPQTTQALDPDAVPTPSVAAKFELPAYVARYRQQQEQWESEERQREDFRPEEMRRHTEGNR